MVQLYHKSYQTLLKCTCSKIFNNGSFFIYSEIIQFIVTKQNLICYLYLSYIFVFLPCLGHKDVSVGSILWLSKP